MEKKMYKIGIPWEDTKSKYDTWQTLICFLPWVQVLLNEQQVQYC